jgi:predicted ATPase/DNA-binding XRE family transcriptional regulator
MSHLSFGGWLMSRRKALGLTREDLAERLSCSPETIYKIEAGTRHPSRQIAELIAGFLGVPTDERELFIAFARGQGGARGSEEHPWRAARRLTNLPAPVTSLIGREREAEQVRDRLSQGGVRLLTLTGPPGIGKTRLAIEAARGLLGSFTDGVYFVPLAPLTDPDLLAATIARSVGVKEGSGDTLPDALAKHFENMRALLVLDNFEQILEAAPEVSQLLTACPWLKVLVTSREPLHLYGERTYPVPPLRLPDAGQLPSIDEIGKYSAVALFVESAQAADPGFALTPENGEAVAQVCAHLGGVPLAIELAAARATHVMPEEMLQMLSGGIQLLTGGARDLPPRHQTLRNAIDWSYNLLNAGEQRLFRRLGTFKGGCTVVAAEAVCNPRGEWGEPISTGLLSLVDKSLLSVERGEGGAAEARYGMLETVREYAVEMLEESGEAAVVRRMHAEFYLALAESAEPELRGRDQKRWLERLSGEHDNLRAALLWLLSQGEEGGLARKEARSYAIRLASALGRFWIMGGHLTEGEGWYARVLEADDGEGSEAAPQYLNALNLAGTIAGLQGDYDKTLLLAGKSLFVARARGDRANMARSLNILGIIARRQGRYSEAEQYFTECLEHYRELGDKTWQAGVLSNLGVVAHIRGKYVEAQGHMGESIALRRDLGDTTGLTISIQNLANMHREMREWEEARALLEESMTLMSQITAQSQRLHVPIAYAQLLCDQGSFDEAEDLIEESLRVARKTGEQSQVGNTLICQARIARHRGDIEGARSLAQEALRSFVKAQEHGTDMVDVIEWLADFRASEGDVAGPEQALILLGAVSAWREGVGAPPPPVKRQLFERVKNRAGEHVGEQHFREALEQGRSLGIEAAVALALGEKG